MVTTQPLAFPIRLPDALFDEALRLLDASRQATNELLIELWPQLDRCATEHTGPAWKHVEQYATRRSGHGSRQERCEKGQSIMSETMMRAPGGLRLHAISITPVCCYLLVGPKSRCSGRAIASRQQLRLVSSILCPHLTREWAKPAVSQASSKRAGE